MGEIKIERGRGGMVMTVTLNRPDMRNALSPSMVNELKAAFEAVERDGGVRVLCLKGEGKAFCAGADISHMRRMKEAPRGGNLKDAEALYDMFLTLYNLSKPVLAMVEGPVLGGGMGFLGTSDVVIATDSSTFGFPEARLGIAPAVISPFLLRKYGDRVIRELFLSARIIGAERAFNLGLINSRLTPEKLKEGGEEWVERFLESSPSALKACKELLREVTSIPLPRARGFVTELLADLRSSPEGVEGLSAFLEKRRPSWHVKGGAGS